MGREFDVIVYGASGFTGAFVSGELARIAELEKDRPRWAVAGRNKERLDKVFTKQNIVSVPTIVADVKDYDSLVAMAKRAKVVINCVGPFRFFGEPVVRACVEAGTHYVDITGEPQFIETMALKYHEEAKEKGLVIVPACGFDCIPAEMGCWFAQSQFKSPSVCNQVENFVTVIAPRFRGHFATFQSAVEGFGAAHRGDLGRLRKQAKAKFTHLPMVTAGARMIRHAGAFFSDLMKSWALPFPGADASVVRTTQVHRNDAGLPAVQFAAYFTLDSWLSVAKMTFYGAIFSILTRWQWGRSLLCAHPKFFTAGVFSHEGPTEEDLANTSFRMTFHSKGYKNGAPSDKKQKPDTHIVTEVAGPEPGYVATPICVVQAAMSIIEGEKKGVDVPRGVLSPGYAFGMNDIFYNRLSANGISFSVLDDDSA